MRRVRSFGYFWYDFVVGDDWRVAIGVAATLLVTYEFSHASISSWWLPPVAVICLLATSLRRAVKGSASKRPASGSSPPGSE